MSIQITALVVVAMAISDTTLGAKYCCYPPAWESLNQFRQIGIKDGAVVTASGTEMVSVDTSTSSVMVNSMASIVSSGQTTSIRTIQDWGKEKQYVIIGGKCTVSSLAGPYTNKCVPDDARLDLPGISFGIGSHQLAFDVFTVTRGNVSASFDIAKPDCIPLAVNSYENDGSGMSSKVYTNLTLGIADPSVFNIPSSCSQPRTKRSYQGHARSLFGV